VPLFEQEDTCRARLVEERKKRPLPGTAGGAPTKYHFIYTPPSGPPHCPPSLQLWSHHPPQQVAPHPPFHLGLAAPPRAQQPSSVWFLCFNCGLGTSLVSVPSLGRASLLGPRHFLSVSQRLRSAHRLRGLAMPTSLAGGDSPGEEVLASTFFSYEHPIIILFDSGALHDFLSLAYAQKAGLTLCATQVPYSISTPRG
jgi:hypothetical protein